MILSANADVVKIAALHPLMADLAKQVGGERVVVYDLVGEGGDLHRFEPKPSDMQKIQASHMVLAGGKHLEPYLDRIRGAIPSARVIEVGLTIPSLTVGKDVVYTCCPAHAVGALDPHWWHGIEHTRRAARVVAQALATSDPDGKAYYMAQAESYGQRLVGLKQWAKNELAVIPRGQRRLITAHNAFAYFAKEFGFEVIAVAGLSKEQNNTPQELAQTIELVRSTGVRAIFPELGAASKSLQSISSATGAVIAKPLIADGNGRGVEAGFEGMIRYNVKVIKEALVTP
jgi:zinc/manganese transport system substrate-binding protein